MEENKLEAAAIEARKRIIAMNIYNDTDSNKYGSTHSRALKDEQTPIYGKGSGNDGGKSVDRSDAGGDLDINGNQVDYPGSGRKKSLLTNEYQKGSRQYPETSAGIDMSKNKGQVVFN